MLTCYAGILRRVRSQSEQEAKQEGQRQSACCRRQQPTATVQQMRCRRLQRSGGCQIDDSCLLGELMAAFFTKQEELRRESPPATNQSQDQGAGCCKYAH